MCVAKTKALISFAITAKLICVFVFAYAKCSFSYDAAHVFYYYFLFYVHSKQLWSFWYQELILSPLNDNK